MLTTDGYGRTSGTGAGVEVPLYDIAARGYAVLHLSLRGSGKSGGANDLYAHYGQDGFDAIEWMAKQPWCNGRVGMVGPSLLGISQWLAAREAPPSLKAIIPEVACGDCYGLLWYPGGMLPGPGREARNQSPGAEAEYPTALKHRDFDDWWRARTTLADAAAAIANRGVAAFIAGGLDDYISPANIRAYEQFTGARKKLFLGPYAHGWHTAYYQELQVAWLDHWLKGFANGVDSDPKVILYIKGANRWRAEEDWPIPDAHPVKMYFQAQHSGSIGSLNDGALAASMPASTPADPVKFTYDPQTGPFLPVLLSATAGRPEIDQRPDEEPTVTWTTPALTTATEVTGYPKLSIWAASSAPDADLVASLTDVAPDGSSHEVIQAYLNAPHAADLHAAPKPLTPNQPALYSFDMLPVVYVFQPGHRLRLTLAGGAKIAPNEPAPQGPGKNPNAFAWTIFQDPDHPSSIDLPIIGTSWEQRRVPDGGNPALTASAALQPIDLGCPAN